MEEIILKTMLRTDSPKKVRQAGFIPGVLNESDLTSTTVQFVGTELNKIISKHGSNAKVWVTIGDDKKFGFIKEVQKSPLDRKIIHIAIQLVNKDKEIKMLIPISFHGRDELEHKELQLQVIKTEIDVTGKASLMPDVIIADVSAKELGDTVTAADLNISADLKSLDADDEIYAIIKAIKEVVEEEPEAAAVAADVLETVVTPA